MTGVRLATAEDVPACAEVINGWIDATDWFPRTHSADEIEGFLRDALPKRDIWVIGDPLAGYLSLDPETAHIGGFYVGRPGFGLGRQLLDRAKEGRNALSLNTHRANPRAQAFYRREGFVPVREEPASLGNDLPELRMEWRR